MKWKGATLGGAKAGPDAGLADGEFEAYASVFGNVDSYGDVVMPGAFTDTLAEWKASGLALPILWGHNMADPDYNIGHVVDAREDGHGLLVRGVIDLESPKAAQVYRLLKAGRVSQMSFAFDVLDGAPGERDGVDVYELRRLKLYEVSVVPIGANQETEVLAVKAAADHMAAALEGADLSAKTAGALRGVRDAIDRALAGAVGGEKGPGDGPADGNGEAVMGGRKSEADPGAAVRRLLDLEMAGLKLLNRKGFDMTLKEKRAAALAAARAIADGAKKDGRDLTDDEVQQIDAKVAEVGDLDAQIERVRKSAASLDRLASFGDDEDDQDDDQERGREDGGEKGGSFGERFVKSAAYRGFKAQYPGGVGNGSPVNIGRVKVGSLEEHFGGVKADPLTSPVARLAPTRLPMVDMVDRDRLTFLDLVSRGRADGAFEYVQITAVERNAAIVPEATSATDDAALKPVSGLSTNIADAKPYTYADGYDVTNQLLADAPAFASYMNQELGYSLDALIEDKLLNGTGVSGEPKGILNTTGVQEAEYASGGDVLEQVKAVRRAITRIVRLPGGTVQAIVVNPETAAEIDLLQDNTGRFFGQGPFGSGPGTLWGRPVVESEKIPVGEYLLGDFKQVALLDVEGLSILAFNQHKDYAQRNMTYVRAELRAIQTIWKPSRLLHLGAAA